MPIRVVPNLAYLPTGGSDHTLDLYLPAKTPGAESPRLVIFIHGGAWVSGDKEDYALLGNHLSENGLAAAIVNYRLTSSIRPVHFPAAAEDVAAAVTWLSAHAREQGYLDGKFVVTGHSAGAHTAAVLAFDPRFAKAAAKVDRYVGLSGIYDVPALVKRFPRYRDWFIKLAFGEEASWTAGSPVTFRLSGKAPWLVIHSREDELVDFAQSEAFAAALKKAGVPEELRLLPRGSHAATIRDLVSPQVLAFLKH